MQITMHYTDVIADINLIESDLRVEAIKYGLYSVDRHEYFNNFYPDKQGEVSIKSNPCRIKYNKPNITNVKDYLLKHDGKIFYAALQKGCRHGIMVQFDIVPIYNSLNIIDDKYREEPTGQLSFCF